MELSLAAQSSYDQGFIRLELFSMGEKKKVKPNQITIRYRDVDDASAAGTVGAARNVRVELYKGMEKTRTLAESLSVSGAPDRVRRQIHSLFGDETGVGLRDIWTGTFHNHEIVNQDKRFLD